LTPRIALPLLVLSLLAACGPSADDYPYLRDEHDPDGGPMTIDAGPPADAGPPDIPDEPLEDWDTTGGGPLTGIFAVEVTVNLNVVIDIEARQLYRLRILQDGTSLRTKTQPCVIDLPTVSGVAELSLPPALERVLRSKAIEDEGDFLSMADPVGAIFDPPASALVLGAELASPLTDPLPTMDDLATAVDEDEDGQPGVTVDARTILCREPEQAYAAIRAIADLSGTVEDLDTITGGVAPGLDQSILATSDPCLAAASTLVITVREGSSFRAIRVGDAEDYDMNGNVSCPEIAYYAAPLFGDHWLR
jgi:hypothetical protein